MSYDLSQEVRSRLEWRAMEALRNWTALPERPVLLKYGENAIFRVELDGRFAVLRLHREGYHDPRALLSELEWMRALGEGGVRVPQPVPGLDGGLLYEIACGRDSAPQHVDVVSWVDGNPLGTNGRLLAHAGERLVTLFNAVGRLAAQVHSVSDLWTPPADFRRPDWGVNGLLGESPVWGRFWDSGWLTAAQADRMRSIRQAVRAKLVSLEANLDTGLIHGDLVRENVMVSGETVSFIDFDDGGFGFRLYDLAVMIASYRTEPSLDRITDAIVQGYRGLRPLSDEQVALLPMFVLLRNLAYVGWISDRPDIPGSRTLFDRFVAESMARAEALDL